MVKSTSSANTSKSSRKSRLDVLPVGSSASGNDTGRPASFIGFGAFAATSSDEASTPKEGDPSYQWTPLYMGPDDTFRSIFTRIYQKRDMITICKALQDLLAYMHDSSTKKKVLVEAMKHYAYLYFTKLAIGLFATGGGISVMSSGENSLSATVMISSSTLRAYALRIWLIAYQYIPKAVLSILSNHVELLGLIFATQSDPATEVRNVSKEDEGSGKSLLLSCTDADCFPAWHDGIVAYTTRILSYGRPTSLYEALCNGLIPISIMEQQDHSKKGDRKASDALNEQQRDTIEELYIRLVGNCLDAMGQWLSVLQQHPLLGPDVPSDLVTVWVKPFTSSATTSSKQHSIRRKTYELLTRVTIHAPSLLLSSARTFQKVIPLALSTEKDAANIPVLFEATLSTLAHSARQQEPSSPVISDAVMNSPVTAEFETELAQSVVKPLKKLLHKACFGAKVDLWGPMILPLIGQYKSLSNQHQILSAVQAGLPLALGLNDKYSSWTAICESSSYMLLRKFAALHASSYEASNDIGASSPDPEHDRASVVLEIAKMWVEGFQFLLSTPASISSNNGGVSARSVQVLERQSRFVQIIATQLGQFDQAVCDGRTCLFVVTPNVQNWFWEEGVVFTMSSQDNVIVQLLRTLQDRNATSQQQSLLNRLLPRLKVLFHARLQQHQISSSTVPSNDCYQLFRAVFDCFCPKTMLGVPMDSNGVADAALERFIMNDLLRWTVIHTSSLTVNTDLSYDQRDYLVVQDFLLLSSCLSDLHSAKQSVWPAFLREVLQAKCDVRYLTSGLSTLIQQQADPVLDWLPCDVLNTFAFDFGCSVDVDEESALDEHFDDEITEARHESSPNHVHKVAFFRLCLGLSSESSPLVISLNVFTDLIGVLDQFSPSLEAEKRFQSHSVLLVLLETIERKRSLLSDGDVNRILLVSWNCLNERLFKEFSVSILSSDALLRKRFLSSALEQLRDYFDLFHDTSSDESMTIWSQKAWLLSLLPSEDGLPQRFLGFEKIDKWKCHPSVLFRLSMSLFRHFQNPSDRFVLVKSWASNSFVSFVLDLVTALSEASDDFLVSVRSRDRRDRCAEFLKAIGGRAMDSCIVESLVDASVERLKLELENRHVCDDDIRAPVAVLSQLLDFMFEPLVLLPAASDEFSCDEINEGDQVWYISDPSNGDVREKAEITKVHFDSASGYFFTIAVCRNGMSQERQTIIERLRKNRQAVQSVSMLEPISTKRKVLRDVIWKELLGPNLLSKPVVSLGELLSILAIQIGFGEDRGIGSVYYDVFRFMKDLEQRIYVAVRENNDNAVSHFLWILSLSIGFGLNTPGVSCGIMSAIWSISADFLFCLLKYREDDFLGERRSLAYALVGLLAATGDGALKLHDENISLFEQYLTLLFHVCTCILQNVENKKFNGYASLVCRTLSEGINICTRTGFDFSSVPALKKAIESSLSAAIQSFSSDWEPTAIETHPFSLFRGLVRDSLATANFGALVAEFSLMNAEGLCRCLFTEPKRNMAFRLLEFASCQEKPLHAVGDNVVLSDKTSSSLKTWINGLDEEEAALVEEDVYIVAEWVPSFLMAEIESWAEAGFEMDVDATIIGRLLSWFCFLRFVDSASPQSFRNRPAFVSYIGKCDAASSILNLGLLHNEIMNDKKHTVTPWIGEVVEYLEDNVSPDITLLATLSLFRTVEVLPSLCKRWWEEDCPAVYTAAVLSVVENFVAPEILKRELDRLKSATSFGKMSVSASLISREVTATYVQDDFSLRVLITLPSTFPFRSAVVDCSKTLGVPQNRWKRWSLQITLMLNSQGGTLQDALLFWKDNVDKEFEGVEPCPVCYSVLHVKTHKLPTLECKTCRNRFHMECLSEWFRSSGKGQCVLCQQPWQGTRVQ